MKTFAVSKTNGVCVSVSAALGTGKLNPFHPPGRKIQHVWTNPEIIKKAAMELGIEPKTIKCVIETI